MMKTLLGFSILLFLTGCGGFAPEPLYDRSPAPGPRPHMQAQMKTAFELEYEKIDRDIFRPACVTCHNPNKMKGDVDLSSLQSILNNPMLFKPGRPLESDLYKALDDDSMPKRADPLSPEAKKRIYDWIESAP